MLGGTAESVGELPPPVGGTVVSARENSPPSTTKLSASHIGRSRIVGTLGVFVERSEPKHICRKNHVTGSVRKLAPEILFVVS
jgi:hypothetical protein